MSGLTEEVVAELDEIKSEIVDIKGMLANAFPSDNETQQPDLVGHKRYHEKQIRAAEAQEMFWTELRRDLARKGTFTLIIIVLGLAATGLMAKTGLLSHTHWFGGNNG